MKSIGAKCGHVKRRLNQGQPLDGKTLEFAHSIVDDSDDDLIKGIARKLEAGENSTTTNITSWLMFYSYM